MSGRVVHVTSGMPYDMYVGRPMPRQRLAGSMLANPYKIGPDFTREAALTRFDLGLRAAVVCDPKWRQRVLECRDLTLACWCAPKGRALIAGDEVVCHAQLILRLAEELAGAA